MLLRIVPRTAATSSPALSCTKLTLNSTAVSAAVLQRAVLATTSPRLRHNAATNDVITSPE